MRLLRIITKKNILIIFVKKKKYDLQTYEYRRKGRDHSSVDTKRSTRVLIFKIMCANEAAKPQKRVHYTSQIAWNVA